MKKVEWIKNEVLKNPVYLLPSLESAPKEWKKALSVRQFEGKMGELYSVTDLEGPTALFLGISDEHSHKTFPQGYPTESLRQCGFNLAAKLRKLKVYEAHLQVKDLSSKEQKAFIEGILLEGYEFDRYRFEKKESVLRFSLDEELPWLEEVIHVIEGVFQARDLVNTPANDLYPETLAEEASSLLSPLGVKVKVYSREEIEALGMTAFLTVAQGSAKEPRLIVMSYEGNPGGEHLTLVGKGLTYDSGGYALKPAKGMVTMKCDMGGAASVIGALYAIAKNKRKVNVQGVIAACENMIDGSAYKNGDIVPTMKGLSIEVGNTDAEGRVTLADALYYATTKLPTDQVIDLATLTGAALVSLGEKTVAAMTNSEETFRDLEKAFHDAEEYVWLMPLFPEMQKAVEGKVGDLKNSVGPYGGTLTAGAFLSRFVECDRWVHLDIAGPAWTDSSYGVYAEGGTGIPVKSLYEYAKSLES